MSQFEGGTSPRGPHSRYEMLTTTGFVTTALEAYKPSSQTWVKIKCLDDLAIALGTTPDLYIRLDIRARETKPP